MNYFVDKFYGVEAYQLIESSYIISDMVNDDFSNCKLFVSLIRDYPQRKPIVFFKVMILSIYEVSLITIGI